MSAGASPPVCLSFAGWLSYCLLSHASASRHLSSRSRYTRPSSTPPLCSRQLIVASHLFAPPPPLTMPPPYDWLCRLRRRCTGIFAVVAIAIVTLVASCRAGVIALVIVVVDVHRHRCCRRLVSRRAVAMVIVVVDVACCAVTIIIDITVRRAVAIVVVASFTLSSPVAPSPICEGCKKVTWLNGLFNIYTNQFVR